MHYGIDVGGTKIELAIFNENFERLNSWRIPTAVDDYQSFLASIAELVDRADAQCGLRGSAGIGLPCIFTKEGQAISANIPCINGKLLAKDLTEILRRPLGFENDANAMTLSEAKGGAADGAQSVLGMILGTGIAGGLCIDGQLHRGRQNMACEFGHIPLACTSLKKYNFPLRSCGCGLTACVEAYLAGPGLSWMCEFFASSYITAPELIEGQEKGDPKATTVLNAYIYCLASYTAQLTMIYDPDVIVIGGGLSNIEEIFERLPEAMNPYLIQGLTPPKIVASKFGDSSGVRGAALCGRDHD